MKTLPKRIATKTTGIFHKEIISKNYKVTDKVFIIRYIDENNKERLKTVRKFSDGIREAYCKEKINEITTKIRLGEELPHIAKISDYSSSFPLFYNIFRSAVYAAFSIFLS